MNTMMNESERLALLVAMEKRLSPMLKEAKDEARQSLMEAQRVDGTDRRAVLVGGEKVGEVGVSYSKAAPYIYAEREAEALEFLRGEGLTEEIPVKGWEKSFELIGDAVVYKPTGEVMEWAGWQPSVAKSAAVRGCEPQDVMRAFGCRLSTVDALDLIEGGV